MNSYELERLAAQRMADFVREADEAAAAAAARRAGRLVRAVAGTLRGVADWIDGGRRGDANGLGTVRALD
ncbi:MAG TPA: hypothetical protein VFL27_10595 [Candidatus Dormibacteraeota bacterium]|nr:hypothetical protein [Candidatus Dormibacteraeota bacterium]